MLPPSSQDAATARDEPTFRRMIRAGWKAAGPIGAVVVGAVLFLFIVVLQPPLWSVGLIVFAASIVWYIGARIFVMEVEQRRETERYLRLLHELNTTALTAKNVNTLLNFAVKRMPELMRAKDCYITFYDEEKKRTIPMRASTDEHAEHYPNANVVDGEQTFTRAAIESSRAFIVDDTHNSPYLPRPLAKQFPRQTVLVLPMQAGTHKIGALIISYALGASLSPEQISFGEQAANQLALAIEKTQLLDSEAHQRKTAETLRTLTGSLTETLDLQELLDRILLSTREVIAYNSIVVMLMLEDELAVVAHHGFKSREQQFTLRISELQHVQEVVQTQKPVIIFDTETDPRWRKLPGSEHIRSWMGIPLMVKNRLIGVLNLNSGKRSFYKEDDAQNALSFANQAAIALDKARLFEAERKRSRELEILRQANLRLVSNLELTPLLEATAEQMLALVPADQVQIFTETNGRYQLGATRWSSEIHNTSENTQALPEFVHAVVQQGAQMIVMDSKTHPLTASWGWSGALAGLPLKVNDTIRGVLIALYHKRHTFDANELLLLNMLADQVAIALKNAQLFERAQQSRRQLEQAYTNTLEGWARALDLRDKETEGHSRRVTELTIQLAQAINIPANELEQIRRGALLHDIGKMGIPDYILRKNGPLNDLEWEIMRKHPQYAYDMLKGIDFLRPALDIPFAHHEKWDGSGYPREISKTDIPLAARLFAIVDVWDALTSDRPYRAAWDKPRVCAYLRAQAGIHFDPDLVPLFLNLVACDNASS